MFWPNSKLSSVSTLVGIVPKFCTTSSTHLHCSRNYQKGFRIVTVLNSRDLERVSVENIHQELPMASQEALLSAIRTFIPALAADRHKGQAGKIAVIGGCQEYTGAPYFAAMSALRVGADLSHVFCAKDAAMVIKSYAPELIVHPILKESYDNVPDGGQGRQDLKDKVITDVAKWLPRFDCIVVGPGLGRDPFMLECVAQIMRDARKANIPLVIDGDGLTLVNSEPSLVQGYELAVLTPNLNEHKRLQAAMGESADSVTAASSSDRLRLLAQRLGNITVVQKGVEDVISNSFETRKISQYGSPRRVGGQGDILSGSIAVLVAWARQFVEANKESRELKGLVRQLTDSPTMMGSIAGCLLVRRAAMLAFQKNRRSTVTSDIVNQLAESLQDIMPVNSDGKRL